MSEKLLLRPSKPVELPFPFLWLNFTLRRGLAMSGNYAQCGKIVGSWVLLLSGLLVRRVRRDSDVGDPHK